MKQELPIAITLLAFGCLPFLWQARNTTEASAATDPAVSASAPWNQPTPTLATSATATATATATSALASFNAEDLTATTSVTASEFLKQVATSFASGQPTFGDLQIENRIYKDTQIIQGRFWCRGMDSRKSRLELILKSKPSMMLTQVCDGRFVYRLIDQGSRQIKFHSLDKLKDEDAGIVEATLPANWFSSGSIDSLFNNLAEAFNFGDLKTSPDNQYVELVGTWNPNHLAKLMVNWVDHREILPEPDWSTLPPQFPHGARLRFANDGTKYAPVEIVFFKFDAESNQPKPSITIRFGSIVEQSISADLFQIDADESGAVDETELYHDRIDLLMGNQRVAEQAGDAIR